MTMSSRRRCALALTLLTLPASLTGCHGPRSHEQHPAHWSYSGSTGPAHWGSLAPEYALCATGKSQSPINVGATVQRDLVNVSFSYQPSPIEIVNNGHTIQVNYQPGSFIEVDGERFELAQFHFHSPSEHLVHGSQADAELHLVHKSAAGKLAVVGVMMKQGGHNAGLDPVWANLPATAGPAKKVNATIDADALLPADQRTYRYSGSLTTPPGTEGVHWCLMVEPVTISPAQLGAFRQLYHGNNRPTQSLDGREVLEDVTR